MKVSTDTELRQSKLLNMHAQHAKSACGGVVLLLCDAHAVYTHKLLVCA